MARKKGKGKKGSKIPTEEPTDEPMTGPAAPGETPRNPEDQEEKDGVPSMDELKAQLNQTAKQLTPEGAGKEHLMLNRELQRAEGIYTQAYVIETEEEIVVR